MPTILVTGGAGYIGSICVKNLIDQGNEVVVYDSLERGHRSAIDERATFVRGDLGDRTRLDRAFAERSIAAVMHFAAYALVGESVEQPELYMRNNVEKGKILLDACRDHGVRAFLFSSTCATYGEPKEMPIHERLPQLPTNPYGESKLLFEKELWKAEEAWGLRAVALRYFNACGADGDLGEDHEAETHLIPIVFEAALGTRPKLFIHGDDYPTPDGTCIRDYIHILDLASAHRLAMESLLSDRGARSRAYNLGVGRGYSVREVIEAAREITGREIPVEVGPRRPGDPPELVAASDLARTELGWTPEHSDLDTVLRTAWSWHQRHPHGYGD
ncbi:MAG: UDP-glucose 4-epimerase GalE [Gemmatimonadetes bacterium]|nr:UDP-glucose 4-epimerase GalE [Gemmatimonadota bacterium]